MRSKIFATFLTLTVLLCGAAAAKLRVDIPDPPPRFLYDGAKALSVSERRRVEDKLGTVNNRGVQIAVAIFPSLEGEPLEDVTMAIAEKWRPGEKDRNDGIVIGVFSKERKIRIEVGYGLEERIPDAVAGRIIRRDMSPRFRDGDVAGGLISAIESIDAYASGRDIPKKERREHKTDWVPIVIFALIVIFFLMNSSRRRRRWISRRGSGNGWDMVPPIIIGGSSGGSSGGGFSGGSMGGFGGFGGGSFGGGGSSGGW